MHMPSSLAARLMGLPTGPIPTDTSRVPTLPAHPLSDDDPAEERGPYRIVQGGVGCAILAADGKPIGWMATKEQAEVCLAALNRPLVGAR